MTAPKLLEEILADCDAQELFQNLNNFEIALESHLPHQILYTAGGEPDTSNQYGAILFNIRMLTGMLANLGFAEK